MVSGVQSCELDLTVPTLSEYAEANKEDYDSCLNILSIILDQAVELGYCKANILDIETNPAKPSVRNRSLEVSKALRLLSLTNNQQNKHMNLLASSKHDHFVVAVYIKHLLGLESNVVCALKWVDFRYVKEYD